MKNTRFFLGQYDPEATKQLEQQDKQDSAEKGQNTNLKKAIKGFKQGLNQVRTK